MITTHGRPHTVQNLALTTSPDTSAPIGSQSYKLRLASTIGCNVSIGDAVNMYLPANTPELFDATPGQTLTATAVTGTGTLSITEII
jgi:hypothetical protein